MWLVARVASRTCLWLSLRFKKSSKRKMACNSLKDQQLENSERCPTRK